MLEYEKMIMSMEDIETIIDECILDLNSSFSFYVNGKIAKEISEYLRFFYDLVDYEFDGEFNDLDEYLVSSISKIDKDGYQIFIEPIRHDGILLEIENNGVAYILIDSLKLKEIDERVKVDRIYICEYVEIEDDEEFECNNDCGLATLLLAQKGEFVVDMADAITDVSNKIDNITCFGFDRNIKYEIQQDLYNITVKLAEYQED